MQKNWLVINFNKKYFLKVGNKAFGCQIGTGGLKNAARKVEGDKSTPSGKWPIKSIYYRPDKINLPKLISNSFLTLNKITKNCGWCDDYKSSDYNRYIEINKNGKAFSYSYENLWREDDVYDIFIEIGFNDDPVISKRGSAIFIHCSFEDLRDTSGCIAISKENLIFLINSIKKHTKINII